MRKQIVLGLTFALACVCALGQEFAPADELAPRYPPDEPLYSQLGANCTPEPVCRALGEPEPPDCPWWCSLPWFNCDCEDRAPATEECRTVDGTRSGEPTPLTFEVIDPKFTRDALFAGYELMYRAHPTDDWLAVCDIRCRYRWGRWKCDEREIDATTCIRHPGRIGYYALRPWYVVTRGRLFGRVVDGVEPWTDEMSFCGATE